MKNAAGNDRYDVARVREAITGPLPSVCPSFREDESLDWDGIANTVEFLLANGSKTLLLTYGDSLLSILSDAECVEFTRFVTRQAAHRAMVIGCGRKWPLFQSLEFAESCRDCGTDVVIPVAPDWAQHADPELLARYYRAVGAVMPVMLLTNMMNGRGIPLSVFETLTPADGIVGAKDDVPLPYGERLGAVIRDKFAFLSGGTADFFMKEAPYGADGYLSVYMRCFPQVSHAFWNAWTAGDTEKCVQLSDTFETAFFSFCDEIGVHFDAAIHGMMELAGITTRRIRMPYSTITEAQMEKLRGFLQERQVIR